MNETQFLAISLNRAKKAIQAEINPKEIEELKAQIQELSAEIGALKTQVQNLQKQRS
ncbi:hypothetical protein [Helicobacter sp.]|uniref:hypothetical protein n=1 Tax=Helicobacter sp. TaxID=218 RepID=UPI0025C02D91|nr:hypothetical protein [Helicobacter sp.]MCI5968182.1 hypothetical protein [Helicobacter sp.]MDY2584168.1 hypothetical protein [Helicobacter sp.]